MRQRGSPQPDLQIVPIEKIVLPLKSRDELSPILAGLHWIWSHRTLKAEIFARLEQKILAGKKATGRTGTGRPAGRWTRGKSSCSAWCASGWTPITTGSNTLPTTTRSCA